jgi:hypothetical protein
MCDEQVLSFQKIILPSVTMLQRVEETFPALRECTVIEVYMYAQKRILFTYSWDLHGQRNKMLSAKIMLILIPYYFRFTMFWLIVLCLDIIIFMYRCCKMVKQSRYRPGVAQRVPESYSFHTPYIPNP